MSGSETPAGLEPLLKKPTHVAIIMDGNGRWAQSRGLPRAAGHRAGTENLREIISAAVEFGVPILTIYAFSTENWGRPKAEIDALMRLFASAFRAELHSLHKNGVCVRHLGLVDGVPSAILKQIRAAEELTRNNVTLQLNVAFNYGGRADIVQAARRLVSEGVQPEEINEAAIAQRLSTAGLPDPDLLIRTGGDLRISNFLIWQVAYSEMYVADVFWPDFCRLEFYKALLAYQQRDRRYGGLAATS